jgi:hypothetical protein
MRTVLGHDQVQEFFWCPVVAQTPLTRLRGIAKAGNLLVCGFVLGLGTWSTFAPLESAAIAFGAVEAEPAAKPYSTLRAASWTRFWSGKVTWSALAKFWSD